MACVCKTCPSVATVYGEFAGWQGAEMSREPGYASHEEMACSWIDTLKCATTQETCANVADTLIPDDGTRTLVNSVIAQETSCVSQGHATSKESETSGTGSETMSIGLLIGGMSMF